MADEQDVPTPEEISQAEKPFFGGIKAGRHVAPQQPEVPSIDSDESYVALKPGQSFMDPEGNRRKKPWEVKRDEDFAQVPEGESFLDPEGNMRRKPKYESVGFTAQMLHDMALTDDAKEQALRTVYGDKVMRDPSGLYVNDNGKMRKPGGRDFASHAGTFASETAPALGMVGGGIAGGALGTAIEPVGGTAAGMFGGGVGGAALGRQFNNIILSLAGVHQSAGEQISSMGWEGAGAAGGEVIGKGIAAIPGIARAAKQQINSADDKLSGLAGKLPDILESMGVSPQMMRNFLGTSEATANQAANITTRAGKGVVPPSALAPGAPMLKKIQEFNDVFNAQNKFGEAARDFYEREATKILESKEIGLNLDTLLTSSEKKVSSERAGKLAIQAAQHDMAAADAALENSTRNFKALAEQTFVPGGEKVAAEAHKQAVERLTLDHGNAAAAAEALVRNGVSDLRTEADRTLNALLRAGEDPSALHRMTAAQFRAYERSNKLRARQMYDAASAVANRGPLPNTTGLIEHADAFLRSIPETLRAKYPSEISSLERLAQEVPEGGVPHEPLGWQDLHLLRSWMRHGIDYQDLTPGMREGALKHFEHRVNAVLHDPNAPPALREAAQLLDQADNFYRTTIPFLQDEMVTTVMNALKSGAGVNPKVVADTFFDPNRTEALRRVRGILGENLWTAVEAAHVQNLVQKSQSLTPGAIDFNKFVSQVQDEVRSGIIDTAYRPQVAAQLRHLVNEIGTLEGSLPVSAEANDTLSMLMRRGAAAKEAADRMVEQDPIRALSQEVRRLDKEHNTAQQQLRAGRKQEPLNFLYENSMAHTPVKAADKILGSQDLITAAAQMFERESPEFKALQQVYAHRFFQRPLGRVGTMRAELADERKGITEELQALMFPGVTKDAMTQLAKDAEFLFSGGGSDLGGSMAAASRVLNPTRHIPIPKLGGVSGYMMMVPGVSIASRFAMGKAFALIMDSVSHPNFINWLAGRLKGSPEERALARQVVQERLRLGGWMGAATGQAMAAPDHSDAPAPPGIKSFADGGRPPTGEPVLVGENGPEVANQ